MSALLQGDTLTRSASFPDLLRDLCWDGALEKDTDASVGRR